MKLTRTDLRKLILEESAQIFEHDVPEKEVKIFSVFRDIKEPLKILMKAYTKDSRPDKSVFIVQTDKIIELLGGIESASKKLMKIAKAADKVANLFVPFVPKLKPGQKSLYKIDTYAIGVVIERLKHHGADSETIKTLVTLIVKVTEKLGVDADVQTLMNLAETVKKNEILSRAELRSLIIEVL